MLLDPIDSLEDEAAALNLWQLYLTTILPYALAESPVSYWASYLCMSTHAY